MRNQIFQKLVASQKASRFAFNCRLVHRLFGVEAARLYYRTRGQVKLVDRIPPPLNELPVQPWSGKADATPIADLHAAMQGIDNASHIGPSPLRGLYSKWWSENREGAFFDNIPTSGTDNSIYTFPNGSSIEFDPAVEAPKSADIEYSETFPVTREGACSGSIGIVGSYNDPKNELWWTGPDGTRFPKRPRPTPGSDQRDFERHFGIKGADPDYENLLKRLQDAGFIVDRVTHKVSGAREVTLRPDPQNPTWYQESIPRVNSAFEAEYGIKLDDRDFATRHEEALKETAELPRIIFAANASAMKAHIQQAKDALRATFPGQKDNSTKFYPFGLGTRSVLFGAHCWFIHPWFVAAAWTKLYGFPKDIRLWIAFFVHDLGYIGKPNMDGPEGESHVEWAANWMHKWFDFDWPMRRLDAKEQVEVDCLAELIEEGKAVGYYSRGNTFWYRAVVENFTWHDLCLYHSRFYAKKNGKPFSKLCVADKLAVAMEPWWLYLPRVHLSGEVWEYFEMAGGKPGSKYNGEPHAGSATQEAPKTTREWFTRMTTYMRAWVEQHKNGDTDTWTPTHPDRVVHTPSGIFIEQDMGAGVSDAMEIKVDPVSRCRHCGFNHSYFDYEYRKLCMRCGTFWEKRNATDA